MAARTKSTESTESAERPAGRGGHGAPGPLRAACGAALAPDALARTLTLGLPVRPSGDRSFWDGADTPTLTAVAARAEADLAVPWPAPLASHYARFFRDGNRTEYEDRVRERQRRLSRAALTAAWTGDVAWLDETVDGVLLLCEQSSWSWAAHDDTFTVHGSVTPTVTDPYLDLGAGEVVGQLAWLDALLGEALDARAPGVRSRLRHEARARVLEPFVQRRDWHWLGLDGDVHNWNPWIHGNVLAATLGLVDDPDEAARLVLLVVDGLDRFVASVPADGAIDEGYSYWWNGAGRALEALDLLRTATGGALDATGVPEVRETARFPHRMQVAGPWYVNVADGPARPAAEQPWHVLHRWGGLLGDAAVTAHADAHRRPGAPAVTEHAGLGRALLGLSSPGWVAAAPAEPPLPRETWLPSVQLLVARERAGRTDGLTLAVKGGHNGEHHNHNDVGSVVVALDGVPVVVDAGQPTYTAQTFGPDRYDIWTMQSGWHSVPVVAGREQTAGRDRAATGVRAETGTERSSLSLDLSGAYPGAAPGTWRRTVTLDRERSEVRVEDRRSPQAVDAHGSAAHGGTVQQGTVQETADEVRFLLHGAVRLTGDGEARVRAPGASRDAVLRWDATAATARLTSREIDDPLLAGVWGARLTRLDLVLAATTDGTGVTVTVSAEVPR